jgi:hypothetical protein
LYEKYRTEKLLARRATRNVSDEERKRLLEGALHPNRSSKFDGAYFYCQILDCDLSAANSPLNGCYTLHLSDSINSIGLTTVALVERLAGWRGSIYSGFASCICFRGSYLFRSRHSQ